MAEADPLGKLSYILHLLEDVKYFHHTNAHACGCNICDKKTSLVSSSITTAIDEVKDVSFSLRASPLLNSVQQSSLLQAQPRLAGLGSPHNPVINLISSSPITNKAVTTCHPVVKLSLDSDKLTSPPMVEENERCLAPHSVHQHTNTHSSLLSSTHRDSGVHTENFLHSNSISPIKSSDPQDSSSESSDSDNHHPKLRLSEANQINPQNSENLKLKCNTQHKKGVKSHKNTSEDLPSLIVPQSSSNGYPKESSQTEQMTSTSPLLLWPHHPPIAHPHLNQIYGYQWVPLQGPQFTAHVSSSQFLSPLSASDAQDSTSLIQDMPLGISNQGTLSASQNYPSAVNNGPYFAWTYPLLINPLSQVNHEQLQNKQTPSPQDFASRFTSTSSLKSESEVQGKSNKLQSILPQIEEINISDMESLSDPILRKDVLLNEGKGASENELISSNLNLSSCNINSSHSDASYYKINANDVSGVMWRPWEAKEDVYKIISDLSIKEEDSVEIRLNKSNSLSEMQAVTAPSNYTDEQLQETDLRSQQKDNLLVIVRDKIKIEDFPDYIGVYLNKECCELGNIFEASSVFKDDEDQIENNSSPKVTPTPPPTPTKDIVISSPPLNNLKTGKRKKKRSNKAQASKENCQILDLASQPICSVRKTLSSTNLQDISNTISQNWQKVNSDGKSRITNEDNIYEIEDGFANENLTSSTAKLNGERSPTILSTENMLTSKSLVLAHQSCPKTPTEGDKQEVPSSCFGEKDFNLIYMNSHELAAHVSNDSKIETNKTLEVSLSKQTQPIATSSTAIPVKAVNDKTTSLLGVSLQLKNCSSEKSVMTRLKKSQSDTSLLVEHACQKLEHLVVGLGGQGKYNCDLSVPPPLMGSCISVSGELLPPESSSMCGAPTLVKSSKDNTIDQPIHGVRKQLISNGTEDNVKVCVTNEQGQYKTKCLTPIHLNSSQNTQNITSQIASKGVQPDCDVVEKIKNITDSSVQTKSNSSSEIDQRSKVTAICHRLQEMQLERDNDPLNRSLPVSRLTLTQGKLKTEGDDVGCVSFEANQSFPKMGRQLKETQDHWTFSARNRVALDWCHASTPLKYDVVTPRNRRSIFGLSPPEQSASSLHATFTHVNEKVQGPPASQSETSSHSSHGEEEHLYPSLENTWDALDLSDRFPRLPNLKEILFNCVTGSICLIDAHRKGKIISVNESFQLMIGLHERVVGQRLFRFIKIRQSVEDLSVSIPQKIVLSDGSVTTVCGKVVSCVVATGEEMPVSIWTVHLQSQPQLVACMINIMATPVVGNFYVNDELDFIQGDDSSLTLAEDCSLIPCICGALTGLMIVQSDGFISDFDYSFFHLLLEYDQLEKVHISELLTHVLKMSEENQNEKPRDCGHNSSGEIHSGLVSGLGDVTRLMELESSQERKESDPDYLLLPLSCFAAAEQIEDISQLSDSESFDKSNSSGPIKPNHGLDERVLPLTSTPLKRGQSDGTESPTNDDCVKVTTGIYSAAFLRGNGSYIDVCLKISSIHTAKGERLFCVWLYIQQDDSSLESNTCEEDSLIGDTTEVEEPQDNEEFVIKKPKKAFSNLKECDGVANLSVGQMVTEIAVLNHSHNAPNEDVMDLEQGIKGSFTERYVTLGTLGQGSFGFVRRARPVDGEPKSVVVKFIRKRSMFDDAWTLEGDDLMPSEVTILRSLNNEHIIKVLDVHENKEFVQMVMEDFGDLDLFDFIDHVDIDEPLACFIFRQIISGIEYLHSSGIMHRDIKDENVIINSTFHCKLIDFGSAAYMLPPGQLFQKFRGTLEYCSPEVHLGKGYRGPELDAWALGVTLYTMVFRENPYTADSIPFQMKKNDFPFTVSEDLSTLLLGLMCCEPCKRFSIFKAMGSDWLRQIVDMSKYIWDDLLGSAPNFEAGD